MADLIDRARFEHESFDRFRVGTQLRAQHLDRGALADHRMNGAVDLSHPALAEQAFDAVLADERTDLEHRRAGWRGLHGRSRCNGCTNLSEAITVGWRSRVSDAFGQIDRSTFRIKTPRDVGAPFVIVGS